MFYACPKPQGEGSCGFQGWADDAGGAAGPNAQKRRAGEASLGVRTYETEIERGKGLV